MNGKKIDKIEEKKEEKKNYTYYLPLKERIKEFEALGYKADCTPGEILIHVPKGISLDVHVLMRKEIKN